MNLCLVGYGAIAEKHMDAFSTIEEVEPYILVGRQREPTAEFAKKWRFRRFTLNIKEALADPKVDAVIITSPNVLHAEQTEQSLQAGKHVLVEIPMALNVNDAEHVTKLSRQKGRRLMVAHTMRYFPGIREVHRRVTTGEMKIYHIVGFFGLMRRMNITSTGKPRSWTDNLLWHFGAHMVDAALWTTGYTKASNVLCQFGPKHPTQSIMDMSLCMTLPGGELFTLAQSYNVSDFRWRLTFIGEQNTLDFDNGTLRDTDGKIIVPYQSIVDLHEQDREFIEAIRRYRDPTITGEDVLPAMRILQTAQESAEAGQRTV